MVLVTSTMTSIETVEVEHPPQGMRSGCSVLDLASPEKALGPHGARGKITGWLLKRKSDGVRSRFFRSANRRFFTVDFEGHLFYYAHTEGNKMASIPLAFRHLLSVEPFAATSDGGQEGVAEEAHSHEESASKGPVSNSFRVPKISFSALKRPSEHHSRPVDHGFILRTTGKEMELLCASKSEAEGWISALREAIALGSESRISSHEGGGGDERKVDLSTSAGSSPAAPLSPRSDDDDPVPEVMVPQSTPEVMNSGWLASSPRDPPQAFCRQHLERLEKEEPKDTKEVKPSRRGLGGLLPRRLGRQRAVAEASHSANATVTSLGFESTVLREAQAWGDDEEREDAGAANTVAGVEVSKRYEDKGRGLSLKERLAQMDFSDDEDDDSL